ncbi:MAG TPA: efflux RND transporter periplasmic adaptor subunit [Opitutales bacterium]|jgi:RND family efflux transporter MFP subunit|nr:efflux RND transporter periplasmic adaptor subunit [Opitutales bacterium]
MPSPDSQPNQDRNDTASSESTSHNPPSILVDLAAQDHQRVSTGYAPRTGRKLGVCAILAAVVLVGAFFFVHFRRSRQDSELQVDTAANANATVSVNIVTAKFGPETQSLPLAGYVNAWYQTTIYARVSGYVANWSADIGDHVTKGQLLATIDTPELDDQLSAAQAKLKVSEANVTVAQSAADFAKATYDRYWVPLKDEPPGVVSEQEKDETKAGYNSSLAKLEAAKSQVNLDEADVKSLTELSGFKEVRAPFDGVITARRIDLGDLVTAGSTASTTSLYSIAQYDQVRVMVDVPQVASKEMTVDTLETFTAREFPDRVFQGKIGRTAAAIDPASRTLRVELDVPNTDLALLPGMEIQTVFAVRQRPLLEIPASALMFRANGPQVAVVDSSGKVSLRNVTIGSDQGDSVEIASGLSPNDRVALNLSSEVADGDHVTIIDSDVAPPPASTSPAMAASTK